MLYRAFALCFLVIAVATAGTAFAHTTGVSKEVVVGKYIVDMGYDPASPRAGDRLLLDLNILDAATKERLPFSDVWVRVIDDATRSTLLATGVAYAEIGPTTVLWDLPETVGENISISLRFQKGESVMAETTIALPVEMSVEVLRMRRVGGVAIGAALVSCLLAFYAGRRMSRRRVI